MSHDTYSLPRRLDDGRIESTSIGFVGSSHGYNAFGEPTTSTYTYEDGTTSTTLMSFGDSERDLLGRITKSVNSDHTYVYDTAGRLTDVFVDAELVPSYSFEYDAQGRRTAWGNCTASYDAQDRLTSYGNFVVSHTLTYTENGERRARTTQDLLGTSTTSYDYDPWAALLAVDLPTGTSIGYVADPKGWCRAREWW